MDSPVAESSPSSEERFRSARSDWLRLQALVHTYYSSNFVSFVTFNGGCLIPTAQIIGGAATAELKF